MARPPSRWSAGEHGNKPARRVGAERSGGCAVAPFSGHGIALWPSWRCGREASGTQLSSNDSFIGPVYDVTARSAAIAAGASGP